jgi:hypothetical protein
MRNYVRSAAMLTAPVALAAALVSGCSEGEASVDKATSSSPATASADFDDVEAGEEAAPVPTLKPGQSGEFKSGATMMRATVVSVKYATPSEVGTSVEAAGQYALVRLTVKNAGKVPGEFSAAVVTWESKMEGPVEASAFGSSNELAKLNATYKSGQSATGNVILDVGAKGGTATFFDATEDPVFNPIDTESPLFKVTLPQ